jgi:hypothetical protein
MEKNKTGKYFKYAIGEIILVVIGILIAMSINNWNEERKIENMGKGYIEEVYSDLKIETSNLNEIILRLSSQYDGTEKVLSVIESNEKFIRDTVQFTKNYFATAHLLIVQRNLNTFDELRSSGQNGLLKNDSLINLLDRFYKNFDHGIANFQGYPLQLRMDLRRIIFPMGNVDDFKYSYKTQKLAPAYLREYLKSEAVYEFLLSILRTSHYNINLFNGLLVDVTELMKFMEENYPYIKGKIKG